MAKLILISSFLLLIIIKSNALRLPTKSQLKVELVSTNQMEAFLKQYPKAIELERKVHVEIHTPEAEAGIAPATVVEYIFGARVAGDSIAAYDNNRLSWSSPQNVKSMLTYPGKGQYGKILTYVSIVCIQSTNNGRAYILSGGIGLDNITIVVEALDTTVYEHYANFYGF